MENSNGVKKAKNGVKVKRMKKVLKKLQSTTTTNSSSTSNSSNTDDSNSITESVKKPPKPDVTTVTNQKSTADLPKRQRRLSYEEDNVLVSLKQPLPVEPKKKPIPRNETMDDSLKCLKCNLFMESAKELTSHQCFPHQCPMCPENINFNNSFLLNEHISKVHTESSSSHQSSESTQEKIFECKLCHTNFQDELNLNKHKSSCSGNEKCENCGSSIISKGGNRFCRKCSHRRKKNPVNGLKETISKENTTSDVDSSEKTLLATIPKNVSKENKVKKRKFSNAKSFLQSKDPSRIKNSKQKECLSTTDNSKLPTSNLISDTDMRKDSSIIKDDKIYETKKKYWCKQCGYGCISQYTFQQHSEQACRQNLQHLMSCEVQLEFKAAQVKQEVQDSSFSSSSAFSSSYSSVSTPQQAYSCRTCNETFNDLISYEFHVERKHQRLKDRDSSYCHVCKTTFSTLFFFKMHDCSGNSQPDVYNSSSNVQSPSTIHNTSLITADRNLGNKSLSHPIANTFHSPDSMLSKNIISDSSGLQPCALPQISPFYNVPSSHLYPMCEDPECPDCMKFLHTLPQNYLWCTSCSRTHLSYPSKTSSIPTENSYQYFASSLLSQPQPIVGKVCDNFIPSYDYEKHLLNQHYYACNEKDISLGNNEQSTPSKVFDTDLSSERVETASNDKDFPQESDSLPVITHVESFAGPDSVASSLDDSGNGNFNPTVAHGYTVEIPACDENTNSSHFVCSRCFLTISDSNDFPIHYLDKHNMKIENVCIL